MHERRARPPTRFALRLGLVLAFAVLPGCAANEMMSPRSAMTAMASPAAPPPPPTAAPARGDASGKDEGPSAPGTPTTEPTGAQAQPDGQAAHGAAVRGPMLIYTAQITMAVFEVNAALSRVEALAHEQGGFLARRDDSSITIRVPVQRFDDTVRRVEQLGDMLHRNVAAEDVTEEFRDLDIRLQSARAVRARLELLLARAAKVEEAVQVEKELDRVVTEIDRLEGRMKFLRDRAAYSTITVAFSPHHEAEAVNRSTFRLPVPWLDELGLRRLLSL